MALEINLLPEKGSNDKKLYINAFRGVLIEYLNGRKTGAECRTAIESIIEEPLTSEKISDVLATLQYIDNGVDQADKAGRLAEWVNVCELAEHGIWYGTQDLLRARLSWSAPV